MNWAFRLVRNFNTLLIELLPFWEKLKIGRKGSPSELYVRRHFIQLALPVRLLIVDLPTRDASQFSLSLHSRQIVPHAIRRVVPLFMELGILTSGLLISSYLHGLVVSILCRHELSALIHISWDVEAAQGLPHLEARRRLMQGLVAFTRAITTILSRYLWLLFVNVLWW